MNNGIQYLQNFADNFNFKVVEKIHEDKRKKTGYFLTENKTTISPVLDYNGINHFLLGVKYSQKKEGKNNSIDLLKKTNKNLLNIEKLKETHEKIRTVLMENGNEEYGDCIIDEICEAVNIEPTTIYYEEDEKPLQELFTKTIPEINDKIIANQF